MAATVSGSVELVSDIMFNIPAGGANLQAYSIPCPIDIDLTYSPGTGPNQVQKGAVYQGSAPGSPVSIDLLTVACVDGTAGFAHVREVIATDDDGANVLKLDLTVASSFLGPYESAVKVDIQPGTAARMSKPLGANGWPVTSSSHLLTLDPGANTVAYRYLILGD